MSSSLQLTASGLAWHSLQEYLRDPTHSFHSFRRFHRDLNIVTFILHSTSIQSAAEA